MNTPSSQNQNVSSSRNKARSPASETTDERRFTDLGNATIFFTMAVPRVRPRVLSASPSSFPMRRSSIVNTFKQQQRINLVRMMFHEPPRTQPVYHHQPPHEAQTSRAPSEFPDSCQESCCKHMTDSSEFNQSQVSATYKTPSLRIRLKSGNSNKQTYSRSLSPTYRSQYVQSTCIQDNLQYKTSTDHSKSSTFHEDTNLSTKKDEHNVTFYHCHNPRESSNPTPVERCPTTGEDLVKSVKLHKKKQEKNKLMRERLEYYKRTHHILNYYLNEDRELGYSETTARYNTPLVDNFFTGQVNPVNKRPQKSDVSAERCKYRSSAVE